jgi:hypothetical protein
LEDHAVIHFAINNESVIPVSENPVGTLDVEKQANGMATTRMPPGHLSELELTSATCRVGVKNNRDFFHQLPCDSVFKLLHFKWRV